MIYSSSVLKYLLPTDPIDLIEQIDPLYHCFEIPPKRAGRKARQITAPSDDLKKTQRDILKLILGKVHPHPSAMAFFEGRSIGANARVHHRCTHLFKTDIHDFFSSIRIDLIKGMLEASFPHLSSFAIEDIIKLTTLDGALPQGAPTSPHLANLVMLDFDASITQLCSRIGASYTRYADDIAVSSNNAEALDIAEPAISSGLTRLGLIQNTQKTFRVGPGKSKIVTGLNVSVECVRPPRSFRKKAIALVRISEKYPGRMRRYYPRVMGHLAHWQGVCGGAVSRQLV